MARSTLILLLIASLGLLALSGAAAADELRWHRTSPRVSFTAGDEVLLFATSGGRARGLESAAVAVQPGSSYRAEVELALPHDAGREALLRVALYERADGRARQRLVFDAPSVAAGSAGPRALDFAAPAWTRAVKVRLLLRGAPRAVDPAAEPARARSPRLVPGERGAAPPPVVLRDEDE